MSPLRGLIKAELPKLTPSERLSLAALQKETAWLRQRRPAAETVQAPARRATPYRKPSLPPVRKCPICPYAYPHTPAQKIIHLGRCYRRWIGRKGYVAAGLQRFSNAEHLDRIRVLQVEKMIQRRMRIFAEEAPAMAARIGPGAVRAIVAARPRSHVLKAAEFRRWVGLRYGTRAHIAPRPQHPDTGAFVASGRPWRGAAQERYWYRQKAKRAQAKLDAAAAAGAS